MVPRSRRAFLATVATGVVGTAGCTAPASDPLAIDAPETRLRGRSAFVADDVAGSIDGVTTVDDPDAADVAVFGAADAEAVRTALAADTTAVVVGADARLTAERACDADGRSYGFYSDSWGGDVNAVAVVPRSSSLETHVFTDVAVPDDLPWALAETVSPSRAGVIDTDPSTAVPSSVADSLTPVGASRIRIRTRPGGIDRWDRVRAASGSDRAWVVLETTATIGGGRDGFAADRIRLVDHVDGRLEAVDAAAAPSDGVEIRARGDRSAGHAEHAFLPRNGAARRSFTALQRAVVTLPELSGPVTYTANGRFRWRDAGLLRDEFWYQHTPGQAVWYHRP